MTKPPANSKAPAEFSEALSSFLELPKYFGEGACVNSNPKMFDGESLSEVIEAKNVCATCPIKNLCLEWATATQESGVWGGMTPFERKKYNKGTRPVDIGEIRMLETNRARLLSSTSATKLAEEFEVTERTIYRWRKKINETQQAS